MSTLALRLCCCINALLKFIYIPLLNFAHIICVSLLDLTIASHPSTALLEALFRSFNRVDGLKDCNIYILCDGCDEDDNHDEEETNTLTVNYKHGTVSKDTAQKYHEHLQILQQKINDKEVPFIPSNNGTTIQLLKLPHRHGSAKAIAAAFELLCIPTPYVLIAQHDNFFVRDVHYLQQIIDYMQVDKDTKSWLQCVHFPSTATLNYVEKVRRRYGLDIQQFCKSELSDMVLTKTNTNAAIGEFIPLVFWYGRTHIARTTYYTDMILKQFPLKVGDHLEEIWGTTQLNEILELKKLHDGNDDFANRFKVLHATYGNYVYFENDQQQEEVLYHMSGRKVRAAAPTRASDNRVHSTTNADGNNNSEKSNFNPQDKAFTTARRAMAVVPGLHFMEEEDDDQREQPKQRSRFRGKCFHCGENGHSFKFCPTLKECIPSMEILDLS